jgi:FeS assembly SUF system protein
MDEEALQQKVIDCLQTIYDPEIPVSIYELGLIYEAEVMPPYNNVQIVMTLTAPSCPSTQDIPVEVEQKVRAIEGVGEVIVIVTWDPPWDSDMMSETAKLELGLL